MLRRFESGVLESGSLSLKLNKPRAKGFPWFWRKLESGWLASMDSGPGLQSAGVTFFRRNDDMDTATDLDSCGPS
jgi:hypothetical protein